MICNKPLSNNSLSNKLLTKFPQKYTIIGLIPLFLAKMSVFVMAHILTNAPTSIELIKKTALKCFILFYMSEYESLEAGKLSKRFEIKEYEVKNIINDMTLSGKIKAKWNDNYLLLKSIDRDSILNMKKLIENIQTITRQNLELMQTAMALANNE